MPDPKDEQIALLVKQIALMNEITGHQADTVKSLKGIITAHEETITHLKATVTAHEGTIRHQRECLEAERTPPPQPPPSEGWDDSPLPNVKKEGHG